jgi:hypothetical protein
VPQATCVDRVAVGRTSYGEQCDRCQPLFPAHSSRLSAMAVAKSAPKRMGQSRGPLRGPTVSASDADNALCGQAPPAELRTTEWSATLAPPSWTSFGSAQEPPRRSGSVPATFRRRSVPATFRCASHLSLLFPAFGDGGGEVGSEADGPKSWTTPWSNGQRIGC